MRALPVVLVLATLVPLAGCIGENPVDDTGDLPQELPVDKAAIFARVQALMADVPCEVDAVGAGTSANLLDLGHAGLEDAGSASLDFHGDLMVAAMSGMTFIDITDPLAPEVLSNFEGAGGYGDVKISPDGMTAIGGAWSIIELVDIRDPVNPVKVGEWALSTPGHPNQGTLNAHMLYAEMINDEQWVFVAPNNNDGVWILKLTGPPEARALEYVTSTLPVQGGPLGPHDMWVTFDEQAGSWLLYSADGYHGWAVFDINDPAAPELVGGLVRPESGYTHTIQAGWVDGTRIVATIAEVGFNLLEIYDATNLMAPVLLATWHVNMESGSVPQPAAPQHEFNIVNGSLYLGHYANGFYVFDLAPIANGMPLLASLDFHPVAHYAVTTPTTAGLFSDVWSVDVIAGVLYVSSMTDGVHVVGYGCNMAGDETLTSTG